MEKLLNLNCEYKNLSPLALAFIGDSVFDILIKEKIISFGNLPAGKLHKKATEKVCCQKQAELMQILLPFLSEEEFSVFKRGRNAKPHHTPKYAKLADYHCATGLEALFGYIYLKGDIKRLRELFDLLKI